MIISACQISLPIESAGTVMQNYLCISVVAGPVGRRSSGRSRPYLQRMRPSRPAHAGAPLATHRPASVASTATQLCFASGRQMSLAYIGSIFHSFRIIVSYCLNQSMFFLRVQVFRCLLLKMTVYLIFIMCSWFCYAPIYAITNYIRLSLSY